MGCCESSQRDDDYEDTRERDPLMGGSNGHMNADGSSNQTSSTKGQQRSDEQSALNRILQQTSNNLIDISAQALSADVTEETEVQHRNKLYASRVNNVRLSSNSRLGPGRLNPVTILSHPSVPPSDLDLVMQAAQKTAHCMGKVVIHPKEDLVVPFGVP